jgi:cytidylate kinase
MKMTSSKRMISTIAIDGPAASGKSTLAKELANELHFLYFDTGVMYRAVTLAALREGVPLDDEQGVSEIAEELDLDVRPASKSDGRQYDVIMNGEDITWEIRSSDVDHDVSQVSMYGGVREAMTERQREIGARGEVVMVGRDIGTVVLPDADLKIYLDASVEARARRRYEECMSRGESVEYEELLDDMRRRDRIDSTRELAPLQAASDAVILNNTELSIDDELQTVLRIIATEEGKE